MRVALENRVVRRIVIGILVVWAVALVMLLCVGLVTRSKHQAVVTHPATPAVQRLRFAAMGDMLAHDSVVGQAKTPSGYDFTRYFAKIRPLYAGADVVFCNPETPVAGDILPISGYPTFNAPREFARDLSASGCNLINLATNHMYDKGQAGVDATIKNWQALKPLALAGANRTASDRDQVAYFTKNGLKVAFLAYMDFSNAALPNDYAVESYHHEVALRSKLAAARAAADVVVVSAHWGDEDSTTLNSDQTRTAQLFAEAGVDVVIGTGPHVLQPVKMLKNAAGHKTLVWYSIGNMLSSQLTVNELTSGVAGFDIVKTTSGITIENLSFRPTFMTYNWPAADRAAQRLSTRTDLVLYPLTEAESQLHQMFPGETLRTRQQFIADTLGSETAITFVP